MRRVLFHPRLLIVLIICGLALVAGSAAITRAAPPIPTPAPRTPRHPSTVPVPGSGVHANPATAARACQPPPPGHTPQHPQQRAARCAAETTGQRPAQSNAGATGARANAVAARPSASPKQTVSNVFPVGSNPAIDAYDSANNSIYVGNDQSSTVSVINLSNDTVSTVSDPNAVINCPGGVAVNTNSGNNTIYVANSCAITNQDGYSAYSVAAIDGASNTVIGVTPLVLPCAPHQIRYDTSANKLFADGGDCGLGYAGYVAAMDATGSSTLTLIPSYDQSLPTVGQGNPAGMALDPTTNLLYVSEHDGDVVFVIDLNQGDTSYNTVLGHVSDPNGTFCSPIGAVYNPLRQEVYIANNCTNGSLSVIDANPSNTTTYNSVIGTIQTGSDPVQIALDPTGHQGFVTDNGDNTLTFFDASTDTFIESFSDASFNGPAGVAFAASNGKVYVVNHNGNSVSEVAPSAGAEQISGTAAGYNRTPRTLTVNVGGTQCAAATETLAYGQTAFSTSIPGSCGTAGQPLSFFISGVPAAVFVNGSTTQSCLTFAPGTTLSNVTLDPTVTPNCSSSSATPTVTGVSPNNGPAGTTTPVTITGTGFVPGTSGTQFFFVPTGATPSSGNQATNVNCASATSCTATAPDEAAGTVDVLATTANGTSSPNPPADQFTYATPAGAETISGTAAGYNKTTRTLTVNVNGVQCAAATQSLAYGQTAFNTVIPGSCGTAGQSLSFFVSGVPAAVFVNGSTTQSCLTFVPGTTLSNVTLDPTVTPSC